jgi:hypothetical protein
MPGGGVPRPVRWWRRALSPRSSRGCCWYHHGDWHTVSELAVSVLAEGAAAGVAAEDMAGFADARAAAASADGWQRQALDSLFNLGTAITPDDEGGYVNALIADGKIRTT